MKVPVIFNHHSCEELSEEQKASLFSGLAETFCCLTNSLKNDLSKPKLKEVKILVNIFPSNKIFFLSINTLKISIS